MGYLPDFDHDVFISYAHDDDDRYPREGRGWVAELHAQLEERVRTYLHQEPSLWLDSEISGNDDFKEKIANRLAKTATLLSVITENFLAHEWFRTELEGFCRNAESKIGLCVGEKRRIFKVMKSEVKRKDLPPQFNDTDRYTFYGPDPDNPKSIHEFRPSLGERQWNLYFSEMDRLAKDIVATLKVMRGMPQGAASATVYLAQTSEDQEFVRSNIKKELQDRNITVLPQGDLSYRGSQFEQQVRDDLKKSDLSIHIFGELPGFTPEGRDRASTSLQHDLAMERAQRSDFRRFIWMPSTLDSPDEHQRQYLDYLRTDTAVQRDAELLQGKVEELKTEVLRSLDQIRRGREQRSRTNLPEPLPTPTPNLVGSSPDEPLSVYIICDAQDLQSPAFLSLNSLLFDRGYEPLKCLVVDSAEEARRMHEEYLQLCDACLIYYGAASAGWVDAKLLDFVKIRCKRQSPFLSKAVYVAPPASELKSRFDTHRAMVIQGGPEFSSEQLSPFLNLLRRT